MTPAPRIAVLCATLGGGGSERVGATLANGFRRAGRDVDVVLFERSGQYLADLDEGVTVVDLGASRGVKALPPLARYLRDSRPVALLAMQSYLGVAALTARGLARAPTRVVVREAQTISIAQRAATATKPKILEALARWCLPRADRLVAPSSGVARDLRDRLGLSNGAVDVILNPLDLDHIWRRADEAVDPLCSPGRPVVLGAGRLIAQKDFATLVRAVKVVNDSGRAVDLVIIGEGPERPALEALADSLGLSGRVTFPGAHQNPYACMKRAAVFVLSSRWEGLPNVLLEALAVGVPVVATDCQSGPREILEDGRWGRLVPVGDADAMASAIVSAVDGALAIPSRSVIEARYGLPMIAQQYLGLLEL